MIITIALTAVAFALGAGATFALAGSPEPGAKPGTAPKPSASQPGGPRIGEGDRGVLATQIDRELQAGQSDRQPLQYPKGNALRIMITGNSWTWPAVRTLPDIARAAGLTDQHLHTQIVSSYGGHADALFKNTDAIEETFPALRTGQWDVLTLLSRPANDGAAEVPEHFLQWMDLAAKANPKIVFHIQEGWPRPAMSFASPEEMKAAVADPKAVLAFMQARRTKDEAVFRALFGALDAKYPGKVHVIPCGAAMVEMVRLFCDKKLPGFDCILESAGGKRGIFSDNGHVSKAAGMHQLIGYLFYGTIYRKSPMLIEGYTPTECMPELDPVLREVAWKAITNSPLSGVKKADSR